MFIILIIMCLLAGIMVINKGFDSYSPIFFIRYIVMFSYMIPFSTKLFVDMARIIYCNEISSDESMSGAIARN